MWDHPRVCGEHTTTGLMLSYLSGSSPRMRGAHFKDVPHGDYEGIIPAYAGSTSSTSWRSTTIRDHPRVCGEHVPASSVDVWSMGSSPRMRGALDTRLGAVSQVGIIPAYAGSTILRPPLCAMCGIIPAYAGSTVSKSGDNRLDRDHPRVCGEHTFFQAPPGVKIGSSPRMRGARSVMI